MKNVKILFLILVSAFSLSAAAQNMGNYIDVVHLKNGSIIKGICHILYIFLLMRTDEVHAHHAGKIRYMRKVYHRIVLHSIECYL